MDCPRGTFSILPGNSVRVTSTVKERKNVVADLMATSVPTPTLSVKSKQYTIYVIKYILCTLAVDPCQRVDCGPDRACKRSPYNSISISPSSRISISSSYQKSLGVECAPLGKLNLTNLSTFLYNFYFSETGGLSLC